ncbi:cache domain-containing sensor histidine kinase [Cohnella fermenti]|uniref:Sensor histidine kinase n=1 Tax=Cohnella fermenti TaxID=2565925 RepID=A0A4S4BH86_9BACL|nr:sensor histidine kinase [Cohnella fermenti]THF73749.1 sensor histidine kinase [Cohnella fermenti]
MRSGKDNRGAFLRRLNIRSRIVLVLLAGLTLHLALMLAVFNVFSQNYLKSSLYRHVEQTHSQIGLSIELMVDDVQMLFLQFLASSDLYRLLGDETLPEEVRRADYRRLASQLIGGNELIGDVFVVTDDKKEYRMRSEEDIVERPDDLFLHSVEASEIPVVGTIKRGLDGDAYIPFGQKLRNFNTGQNAGTIIFYLEESKLFEAYEASMEGLGYSFIVGGGNHIVSHPDKARLGDDLPESDRFHPADRAGYRSMKENGREYLVITYPLNQRLRTLGVDWKFVSVVSSPDLLTAVSEGNRIAILFAGSAFVFLFVLSMVIASRITDPVLRLRRKLASFGKTGLRTIEKRHLRGDEINELENSYYQMVDRINQLLTENDEEKEKQRRMELVALQSQINPHFLYNTLDAIAWTARLRKQPEIERMISSLATFFRISLHKGDKFIPIEEEIRLVQSFVTVELMRFPDKFEVVYDMAEGIRGQRILKLILQPLVENAIKHGISEKRGKGTIEVTGRMDGGFLVFEVSDDGVGFKGDRPLETAGADVLFQSGYGLRNVNERIKLEYGADCGLSVRSERGVGTTVTVRIRREP